MPIKKSQDDAAVFCEKTLGIKNASNEVARKIVSAWEKGFSGSADEDINILELEIPRVSFWVVDVETTGQQPPADRIIEIGAVEIRNYQRTRHFTSLINPGIEVSEFVTGLTGISNQMLDNAPGPEEAISLLGSLLEKGVFVAHSAAFDWRFVRNEMELLNGRAPSPPRICTVKLSRRLRPDLKSHNLDEMARALKLKFEDKASVRGRHRALGDAEVTAQLLIRLLKALKALEIRTVADLNKFQNMPFRKTRKLLEQLK